MTKRHDLEGGPSVSSASREPRHPGAHPRTTTRSSTSSMNARTASLCGSLASAGVRRSPREFPLSASGGTSRNGRSSVPSQAARTLGGGINDVGREHVGEVVCDGAQPVVPEVEAPIPEHVRVRSGAWRRSLLPRGPAATEWCLWHATARPSVGADEVPNTVRGRAHTARASLAYP